MKQDCSFRLIPQLLFALIFKKEGKFNISVADLVKDMLNFCSYI